MLPDVSPRARLDQYTWKLYTTSNLCRPRPAPPGFVHGSDAHRLVLGPVAACSLERDRCIAPPGHSRNQHCYEQTALTLLLRHHNFSTCLQRVRVSGNPGYCTTVIAAPPQEPWTESPR